MRYDINVLMMGVRCGLLDRAFSLRPGSLWFKSRHDQIVFRFVLISIGDGSEIKQQLVQLEGKTSFRRDLT